MKKYNLKVEQNCQQSIRIDYIAYLMLIPSIAPIVLIFMSTSMPMAFYGGSYVITCCVLALLLICQYKTVIHFQNNTYLSKYALFTFFLVIFISMTYTIVSKYLAFKLDGEDAGIFISMIRDASHGNFGYATSVGFYH